MATPRPTLEDLTGHIDGLRRLAGVLVRDEAAADDLVQDTLIAAARGSSGPRGATRAWLRGIARNLARKQFRDVNRRRRRELGAAVPEASAATDEAAAGLEIQRRVIALLEALPGSERTALYLRYFEDLPPRRIAARMACPVATVHTHIRRGRERLRAGLDHAAGGSRARWTLALLPMTRPGKAFSAALGGLAMKKVLTAVVLVAVLALGGFLLWDGMLRSDEPALDDAARRTAEAPQAPGLEPGATVPDPAAEPGPDAEQGAGSVRHLLTVRLATSGGEVLPGSARIVAKPIRDMRPGERWDGKDFAVEATAASWPHEADITALFAEHQQPMIELDVALDHPAYMPVSQRLKLSMASPAAGGRVVHYEATLRVRPAAVLHGRVLSQEGLPLASVQVGAWPAGTDAYGRSLALALTDVDGRYRLRTYGGMTYAIVAVEAGRLPGRAEARVERGGRTPVEDITLSEGSMLAGVVLLNDEPLRGAAITCRRNQDGEDWRKTYAGLWRPDVVLEVETWTGPLRRAHLAQLSVRETNDGLALAQGGVVTSPQGRFAIAGLKPGTHRLRLAPWTRAGFVHRGLLETMKQAFVAPDEAVTLRLEASIARFDVRAGDAPLANASVKVGIGGKVHGLTEEQLAELAEEVGSEELASLGEHQATVRTKEGGLTLPVLVPPERELRLSISCEGFRTRALRVFSKPAADSQTYTIVLEPDAPKAGIDSETPEETAPTHGSLVVALKSPDGTAIPRAAVGLFRRGKAHPEWRRRARGAGNVFRFDDIRPGTWRLVVRPGGTWAGAEAFWLDAETAVEIRAGEVSRVEVATSRGGRLRLAARDTAGRPTHARVRVLDEDGKPLDLKIVARSSGGHGMGSASLSVPGPNEVAEVLAPGRYTVEFSRRRLKPGEVAPVRREIVVRPGRLIDLEIELP